MYVPADGTGCFRCGPKGWRVTQLITTFLPSGYRYKISVPCFCCCGSSSVTMRRGWLTPKHGRVPESTLHNVQPVTEHPFHSVVTLAKIDHLDPRFICRIPPTPPPPSPQKGAGGWASTPPSLLCRAAAGVQNLRVEIWLALDPMQEKNKRRCSQACDVHSGRILRDPRGALVLLVLIRDYILVVATIARTLGKCVIPPAAVSLLLP